MTGATMSFLTLLSNLVNSSATRELKDGWCFFDPETDREDVGDTEIEERDVKVSTRA
jgi:hypothetical protein